METFLFLMCPSDYFDSTFFYHIADLCHPWTFMLSIRQTTDTNVDGTDFFTDQSVYLFQDSFVFYGFYRVGAFASVTGHHCCQTDIFRIILKEIGSVLKCCQASDSGLSILKHSKSSDLLRKLLLSHVWRVPSSKVLSCKHERLSDLLTLISYYKNKICIFPRLSFTTSESTW